MCIRDRIRCDSDWTALLFKGLARSHSGSQIPREKSFRLLPELPRTDSWGRRFGRPRLRFAISFKICVFSWLGSLAARVARSGPPTAKFWPSRPRCACNPLAILMRAA
eukprot:9522459-Alexandrium_andersonii.AAC.1